MYNPFTLWSPDTRTIEIKISGTLFQLSYCSLATVLLTAIQNWRVPLGKGILNVRAMKCYRYVWMYPTIQKSPVEVSVNGAKTVLDCFIILLWRTWPLGFTVVQSAKIWNTKVIKIKHACVTVIKDFKKHNIHCTVVQNAKLLLETCSCSKYRRYAQIQIIMLKWKWSYM